MPSRPVDRVLVVEDDAATLRFLRVLFAGDEGVTIVECSDGEEAVAVLSQQDFALVILDLWMPRLDGHAVIEVFRRRPAAARPRVIVISAERITTLSELPHDIVQIAVEKPFDIEELREVVRWCLTVDTTAATDDPTPVIESSYQSRGTDGARAERFRAFLQQISAAHGEQRRDPTIPGQQRKRGTARPKSDG